MTLLRGRHVSTDVAVVAGEPRWWRHVTGIAVGDGMFDTWTVHAARDPELEGYLHGWIGDHLSDYTGMLNLETIGGRVIEAHPRPSDPWPAPHGPAPVRALAAPLPARHCA